MRPRLRINEAFSAGISLFLSFAPTGIFSGRPAVKSNENVCALLLAAVWQQALFVLQKNIGLNWATEGSESRGRSIARTKVCFR